LPQAPRNNKRIGSRKNWRRRLTRSDFPLFH
jgi:hypothetical protein